MRPTRLAPASPSCLKDLTWSLLGGAFSAANHRYWTVAVGDAVLADRAEERARELAMAVTPDDDEIRGLREGLQHRRRMPFDN